MARPSKHDGVIYRADAAKSGGCDTGTAGRRHWESTGTEDWDEAQRRLRERLQARDNRTLEVVRKGEQLSFHDWADVFLENYSQPPIRAEKTHVANKRAMKHLEADLARGG